MENGLYGQKKLGVGLGLLATAAGLGVAQLIVGLVRGSASPVVPVGQEFIDRVPKSLKDWAIAQFGTNDKAVLVIGALIVVFGFGALIGLLMMRGDRVGAYLITSVIGAVGVWAVMIRPDPSLGRVLPTLVGTVVSIGVLVWLGPAVETAPDGERIVGTVDRRQFITSAVGIGSAAVVAGGLGQILQGNSGVGDERADIILPEVDSIVRSARPTGESELGVEGIESFVVANKDFYRIDTALVVPQVRTADWKLSIGGMVDRPIELTFDDLLARPQIERNITLSCVSNPVGGPLVGNAVWQGVLLKDILDEAGVQQGAEQVVSRSIDGWTCGSPLESIMDGRDAMLAIAMNGEPLPAEHGYPVRIVVPGLFGYVSATKWVTEIALTRWEDFDAYWIPRGWSKLGPVKTMARIDTPRSGSKKSGDIAIGGVAWAVHRGVSKVQIRVDDGDWLDAELGSVPSVDTWVQWVYRLQGATPGDHSIEARALDGNGEEQPQEPAAVAPNGAQGYHRISLTVDG